MHNADDFDNSRLAGHYLREVRDRNGQELTTFDGRYGRVGYIRIDHDRYCMMCKGMHLACLAVDASEGEYAEAAICLSCVTAGFDKVTT